MTKIFIVVAAAAMVATTATASSAQFYWAESGLPLLRLTGGKWKGEVLDIVQNLPGLNDPQMGVVETNKKTYIIFGLAVNPGSGPIYAVPRRGVPTQ